MDKEEEDLKEALEKAQQVFVVGAGHADFAKIKARLMAFAKGEIRLKAFAKSEVLKGFETSACHYICPNDLMIRDANEAHLIKGDLHPRPDKRFKCLGAKRGSIYDYKKGYVKRSKKDVFRKK